MAQFGRPSADTYLGNYTDQGGGAVNIYQTIDEVVRSDADYVRSEVAPANSPYVTKLTSVEDPLSNVNHIVRYAYAKSAAGGATINLVVQLRQDYVNEGAQGTLIRQESVNDITEAWTGGTFTLLAGEADAITAYGNLYIRLVSNQV